MKLVLTSYPINLIGQIVHAIDVVPKDCNIVCIPTAAMVEDNFEDWLNPELDAFRDAGFDLDVLDLAIASEEQCIEKLNRADIIYVTGGNTFYLLEKIRQTNFEKHLRNALKLGAIYIGSSAGSIVCTPDIDYVREVDDPKKANLKSTQGMGLIDFYLMVHMNQPKFSNAMNKAIIELEKVNAQIRRIEDSQALYIDGNLISIISE